jgi:hypothetical protein
VNVFLGFSNGPVCHRADGLEEEADNDAIAQSVCHRADGLEVHMLRRACFGGVCHRADGLED